MRAPRDVCDNPFYSLTCSVFDYNLQRLSVPWKWSGSSDNDNRGSARTIMGAGLFKSTPRRGNFKALWKFGLILCPGCGAAEGWNGWRGEGNRFAFCRALKTVSLHPSPQLSPCSVPSAVRLFLADSNQLEGSVCLICMRLFKTKKKVCISQGDGKQRKEMPFII